MQTNQIVFDRLRAVTFNPVGVGVDSASGFHRFSPVVIDVEALRASIDGKITTRNLFLKD